METFPAVGISTDASGPDIMKQKPSKLSESIFSVKDRTQMIIDGIIFGLAIALGYITILHMTGNTLLAGTSAFVITLLSPQIYVFMLREGGLIQKVKAPNKLLKFFLLFTILMIVGIVYIPPLQILFRTTPITDAAIWLIIIGFSLVTSVFRLGVDYGTKRNVFRMHRKSKPLMTKLNVSRAEV
jgi:Ca2+-transporting ATPase